MFVWTTTKKISIAWGNNSSHLEKLLNAFFMSFDKFMNFSCFHHFSSQVDDWHKIWQVD